MKKKRLMAAGLSAAMVLSMTACGGKEAPAETKKRRDEDRSREGTGRAGQRRKALLCEAGIRGNRENHGIYNDGGNSAAGT